MTFGDVINRVFKNVGKADAGEDPTTLLEDLKDMLRVDIPLIAGGAFYEGLTSLSVGDPAEEDGVYSFPPLLRSFGGALQLVDHDDMASSPPSITYVEPRFLQSDSDVFYQKYKSGNAQSDSDYGKPTEFLVIGREIHLRPIPKKTAVAAPWWGTILFTGTVYPDVDSYTVSTVVTQPLLVPLLIAELTLVEAARRQNDVAAGVWGPIAEKRRRDLGSIQLDTWRRVQPVKEF